MTQNIKAAIMTLLFIALSTNFYAASGEFERMPPSKAYKDLDAQLNAVYKKIRSSLSQENQIKLKIWQMAWVKNKESLAMQSDSPSEQEKILLKTTRDRLEELQGLLIAVEEDPERELDFSDENARSRHLNANGLTELLEANLQEESLRITLGLTLPPGVSYSGRYIRAMWPEVDFFNSDTNQKLLVCQFTTPDQDNPVETSTTWHNGYYLSPDAGFAVVEAMDEEAFHSDGAQGQSCYYVYKLPELSKVPRSVSSDSAPKEVTLKPTQTLSKAQLETNYPDIKATTPKGSDSKNVGSASLPVNTQSLSIPREFVGTWDSRPVSEESQMVISENEIHYHMGEVVGTVTKVTRTGPNQIACELRWPRFLDHWLVKISDGCRGLVGCYRGTAEPGSHKSLANTLPPRNPPRNPMRRFLSAKSTEKARTLSASSCSPRQAGTMLSLTSSSTQIFQQAGRNPSRFPPNAPIPRSAPDPSSRPASPKMSKRVGRNNNELYLCTMKRINITINGNSSLTSSGFGLIKI